MKTYFEAIETAYESSSSSSDSSISIEQLFDYFTKMFDVLLGAAIGMAFSVYFPRIPMFCVMKCSRSHSYRKMAYKIRMSTTVIQILLEVALIIALVVLLIQSKFYLFLVNIPAVACYGIMLLWALAFDIYYSCIYKRYMNEGNYEEHLFSEGKKNKTHKANAHSPSKASTQYDTQRSLNSMYPSYRDTQGQSSFSLASMSQIAP